jgi:hypothetical protein
LFGFLYRKGKSMQGFLHSNEAAGKSWALEAFGHVFGAAHKEQIADAITKAQAALVPWAKIAAVVLPLAAKLILGQPITAQEIVTAIEALIGQPPTPTTEPAPA